MESKRIVLPRRGAVELPFLNAWGENIYLQSGAFDLDPVTITATSTSGSPVLLADNLFVGFLDFLPGGRMTADETTITVTPPPGGRMFVRDDQDPEISWDEYNAEVLGGLPGRGLPGRDDGEFFDAVEYCTWVEQKAQAVAQGSGDVRRILDDGFVADYLDRLAAMGLPPGKVTLDSGWVIQNGPGSGGDWAPDTERFPDLARTAAAIRDAGHVPGLWFSASRANTTSRFYREDPSHFSIERDKATEAGPGKESERYALPDERYLEHYRTVFSRYCGMGFRKFKLDMHYATKSLMRDQLRLIHLAIKESDPGAEVEHHIPDIFVARYADVVRTNDVLIQPGRDWRGLTAAHFRICSRSAPDKVLNLDHVGGNDPAVAPADVVEHWRMFTDAPGHPVISLLPDRFGSVVVDEIHDGLWSYHKRRPLVDMTKTAVPPR